MKKTIKLVLSIFIIVTFLAACSNRNSAETGMPSGSENSANSVLADDSDDNDKTAADAWVLIYEKTRQREDEVSGMYSDSYSWEKDEVNKQMCHYHVKIADGVPYQKSIFAMTSTLPPEYGDPGSKITFDIATTLVETDIAKYYFGDSCSVQLGAPDKELGIAGYYFWNILDEGKESRTNPDSVGAGTGGDDIDYGSSCSVFWHFPNNPQPGDRFSVYFMSFGVETEWCYEFNAVSSDDGTKEPVASTDGDEPVPVINDDIQQGIYADGSDLNFDDFAFYNEVYEHGIPDGAYYPETQYAAGSWRYELFVYKEGSYDTDYMELGYADINIEEKSKAAVLTLHPRIGNDGYESFPVTDEEIGYEPFNGELDELSGLTFYGNNLDLYLNYYYAYEGREYIIGSLFKSSDLFAGIIMIRGQD
ncbi:MAG: hypothetical protein IJI66_03505 [Erysipelotrichaceae bacterium]|nr:hypothetical protein [Erysipelotrichaceae bacterium]